MRTIKLIQERITGWADDPHQLVEAVAILTDEDGSTESVPVTLQRHGTCMDDGTSASVYMAAGGRKIRVCSICAVAGRGSYAPVGMVANA